MGGNNWRHPTLNEWQKQRARHLRKVKCLQDPNSENLGTPNLTEVNYYRAGLSSEVCNNTFRTSKRRIRIFLIDCFIGGLVNLIRIDGKIYENSYLWTRGKFLNLK